MKNSELQLVRKFLRKIVLGITLPTEYVTARRADLQRALKTVRTVNDHSEHELLFLGYKPPLLGIVANGISSNEHSHALHSFEVIDVRSKEIAGYVDGRSRETIQLGEKNLTIVQCSSRKQYLELEVHQSNDRILSLFRKKKPGNIDLTKYEYDFLKLQYSTPREIRAAVISDGEKFNVFPIDLFGFVGEEYMILSLRHQMKSCRQLESTGKIATWTVDAKQAKEVYALGKNHGFDFRPAAELLLTEVRSPMYKFPAPNGAIAAEEFEVVRKIEPDYGHHRLFILKRVGNKAEPDENSLVHVHRAYAEWLLKQGFSLKQISR